MATTNQSESLTIHRTFNATPEEVYNAWMDADQRKQWFVPSNETMSCTQCEIDPAVDGSYTLTMSNKETGEDYIAIGHFTELTPHNKIAFTWSWKDRPKSAQNTHCTIELTPSPCGSQTDMIFTHTQLPDTQSRDDHHKGWTGCFNELVTHLAV
ncbi:SRPBCC family protein [Poriferisphaera sp. WC338]|uniref:SRPBCC family protein n=1 Tax=Poriferisphaera sp. WC338 TaxID=3425129 RepID=UPI003D81BEEB